MERTLIHDPTYAESLEALGSDMERLDDALLGALWAISTNPEVYDIVKGTLRTRLVKTDPLGGLPPLRIWFHIDEDGNHVHLEYIEAIEQDA